MQFDTGRSVILDHVPYVFCTLVAGQRINIRSDEGHQSRVLYRNIAVPAIERDDVFSDARIDVSQTPVTFAFSQLVRQCLDGDLPVDLG